MSNPDTIEQAAVAAGRLRYVEISLFEVTGKASATVDVVELAVFLSAASSAHGYRAQLFEHLLPVSVGLPGATSLTASYDENIDVVIARLSDLDDATLFTVLVDVIYVAARWGMVVHLGRMSVAADGPALRAIQRAIFDLDLVIADAESLRAVLGAGDDQVLIELRGLIDDAHGLYGEA